MKQLVLVGVVAFSLTTLASCMKEYQCNCPAGTTAGVKTTSKSAAKETCEASGCTL